MDCEPCLGRLVESAILRAGEKRDAHNRQTTVHRIRMVKKRQHAMQKDGKRVRLSRRGEAKLRRVTMAGLIDKVHWLGHASFMIHGEKVVYIDPYELRLCEQADIILITHAHFDHCSLEDLRKIIKADTVIVTVAENEAKLSPLSSDVGDIKLIKPGDRVEVDGVSIAAVPAYNTNKDFHPKSKQWVGFVIEVGGERLYHAGDTDLVEEMAEVDCDIALLPVSGTYVMTAEEAAEASKRIAPRIAVPMHYGRIVGDDKDAKRFAELCDCEVRILEKD